MFDPKKIAEDLEWLKNNPAFDERPASIIEFLGEDYLNIEKGVRPGVRQALIDIFGDTVNGDRIALYRWAIFTGAIGIGKTTMASIILPYLVHWVLCLKNPQEYFGLLPGSRIAFMMMSTSENQAKETVFGDVKARIEYSQWFQNNYPYDPKFTNQIRFGKNIWILPGNSAETRFEGYNILGGILDEADSHKVTRDRDYADQGFDTINSRIDSRFQDRGFLIVVGQMKKANGFAARKYKEFQEDPEAHTVRMTIWESLGWQKFSNADGSRDSFWYDAKRKDIVQAEIAKFLGYPDNLIEIPSVYLKSFKNNPEKALRDLAGIPPQAGAAFISLAHKIDDAIQRWIDQYGEESPVTSDPTHPELADWFTNPTPAKRAVHLDIGYSANGDAAGIAMGHVSHVVKEDDEEEEKPFIVIDCLIRVKAPPGREVLISDLRKYIYELKSRGFRIKTVSMDGFQSTDTKQQLRKKRFHVTYLSVDKSKLPYEDLRDALYEDRLSLPPYMTYINAGDTDEINIIQRELSELEEDERKIDHPATGSKDVADAVAGVVNTLMGDRSYQRGVRSNRATLEEDVDLEKLLTGTDGYTGGADYSSGFGGSGVKAPIPPNLLDNVLSFPIPDSLRPDRRS